MGSSRIISINDLVATGALQLGDGYRTKRNEHGQPGYRIIRVADVMDDVVSIEGPDFVSEKYAKAIGVKAGRPGDILLTTKGTVGRVAILPEGADRVVYSPQLCFFRVLDVGVLVPRFLRYWFSSTEFWHQAADRMNNTDMAAYINLADIRSLKVSLPEVSEQHAVANVLGALDDKIAANALLSKKSVEVAQALFERTLESAEVQWKPLGAVATTVLGGTPSKDNLSYWTEGTVAWLNSGKANEDRIIHPSEYITDEALQRSAAKLMPVGATLIAITGATLGQVARLEVEASGNQSLVGIWNVDQHLNDWLYFAVRGQIPKLLTRATGAAQQHVNKRDVDALSVPVVEASDLASFYEAVHPLLGVAVTADKENVNLAATRDTLLPRLMSGKLGVKEAEKVLEDAGV